MNAYDVLDFLKSNADRKYKSIQIAKYFQVSTQTMTMTLTALGTKVLSEVNGKTRHWWIESDEVRKQKQARQVEYEAKMLRTKRVLKMDRGMSDALTRCRELYQNGGNFKSIC